jgi:hypothetical protein
MNSQLYYFYIFVPFAVVLYMISVDENVSKFIVLSFKFLQVQVIRGIFWIKFYPKLRLDTAILKWKSKQILKK